MNIRPFLAYSFLPHMKNFIFFASSTLFGYFDTSVALYLLQAVSRSRHFCFGIGLCAAHFAPNNARLGNLEHALAFSGYAGADLRKGKPVFDKSQKLTKSSMNLALVDNDRV